MTKDEVDAALRRCYPWFTSVAIFSAAVNILFLTGSLYMMQVYDRVLASKSISTLVGISLIALAAYLLLGFLDGIRSYLLSRIGAYFDSLLSSRVYDASVQLPLKGIRGSELTAPVRDLDQIRMFLSGLGPAALFDIPFMPFFLFIVYLLHPWLGILTLSGVVLIVGLTLLTELRSKEPGLAVAEATGVRLNLIESLRRNAEALLALGMRPSFAARFAKASEQHVDATLKAADVVNSIGSVAKILRMIMQSAALGLGAYLVIKGEMSAGAIIAASILTARALAPIETAVSHWRGFVAARISYHRLSETLRQVPPAGQSLPLPPPRRNIVLDEVVATAPGQPTVILAGVSLRLDAGQALGLIGPTGCGKSSLARVVVGVWPILKGSIRIDGATTDQWGASLGGYIGYLPQDIELFPGTVAENIARFRPGAEPQTVVAAARAAGAHEMILQLSMGYDTVVGEAGARLSGGQRQRIALARALFGDPFLVVLDEPNANLDHDGDEALNMAIRSVKERNGIVIIITHRPSGLAAVDQVALMKEGRIRSIGPRDEVLQKMVQPVPTKPVAKMPAVYKPGATA